MPKPFYRLRIKSLKFISAVDAGAQGPIANVALIKRASAGGDFEVTCRVAKADPHLGLVFGWALATSLDGGASPHVDLQNDAIVGDDELIKIAAAFAESGAAADVLHDENVDGKIVFMMPLTAEVSKALGISSNVHGLAIAMKPSPATFKRFLAKELNAFSIGGIGERELVVAAKALWSTAEQNDLPDSSFLYIESGGSKDDSGKTTPRSLRHFPFKTADGAIDLPHLRNAIAQIPKSDLSEALQTKLQGKAQKLLEEQNAEKRGVAKAGGEWDESKHPRGPGGKFGSGGGGGSAERAQQDKARREHADQASQVAHRATAAANANPHPDKYNEAARLHGVAAQAHIQAGNRAGYDKHSEERTAMRRAGAAMASNRATLEANASGNPSDHARAAEHAYNAADLHRGTPQERRYLDAANLHEIKGGMRREVHSDGRSTEHWGSKKRRVSKQAVLTSAVDGHQHTIDLDDPADPWRDSLSTSYQTSEGADASHCHAWTFDPDTGAITIAADSGHTHATDAVVPDDVRAEAAANEDGERCRNCNAMCDEDCRFCPSCGQAMASSGMPVKVAGEGGDDGSGPTIVAISLSAPKCADCGAAMSATDEACPSCGKAVTAKSSPSSASRNVNGETKEPETMADNTEEIRQLKAENALLKSMATLTDAQRAHHNKLIAKGVKSDADRFLALSASQRDTELAEIAKADAVVYVSKRTGREYRQSDHLEVIEAAKSVDAMDEIEKRLKGEREDLEFSKRGATTLVHFSKGGKGNLQARIMKALAHEFTDPSEYAEAERALKAANHALGETLSGPKGANPFTDAASGDSPAARLEAAVHDFAKRNNLTYAVAFERGTATDQTIRQLYNEAHAAGN